MMTSMLAGLGQIEHALVEKVGARLGQGVTSMFRFGQACGAMYATLVTMGIPVTFVLPRTWQAHHHIGPTPDAAPQRAAQLYPQIALRLARKVDGNRADALLIAAYAQDALAKPSNITQIAGHHHMRHEDAGAATG
jgi:crossover junction endodeoxyribonuclease RuvC